MTGPRLNVLLVSTQFPTPPRSGFETRVHHLVRQLRRRHDVTLLSYARPDQRAAAAELGRDLRVVTVERPPLGVVAKRAQQLSSLAARLPYACRSIRSAEMQAAIDRLCSETAFDAVQLESSLLCAFDFPASARLILDEHNIEYEVFARMNEGERSVARRVFNHREDRRFRRFEQAWWERVDGVVLTSAREERIVWGRVPHGQTEVVPNGVDLDYFRPAGVAAEPDTVVFNGILDYRPNLDAALHLVDEVWPLVRARRPRARLEIVGRGSPPELPRLRGPGITLTGEVPDLRPHLARAAVVAVPVRMGGGTRLKVVEGLAMARPIVSTTLGCEGVDVRDGEHLLVRDGARAFADGIVELLADADAAAALGNAGRARMEERYSWGVAGVRLLELYDRVFGATPAEAVAA